MIVFIDHAHTGAPYGRKESCKEENKVVRKEGRKVVKKVGNIVKEGRDLINVCNLYRYCFKFVCSDISHFPP